MLMKQRRLDKLTPLFEPNPYQITYIKGSRITEKRLKDGKYLSQNCSKVKPSFSVGMSSKDTDQTDFHSENSLDIDSSAAENNLPDHVTPAVINVEENAQVMNSVQPLQNLQPVIQPRRSHRIRKTPVWHEDYEIS